MGYREPETGAYICDTSSVCSVCNREFDHDDEDCITCPVCDGVVCGDCRKNCDWCYSRGCIGCLIEDEGQYYCGVQCQNKHFRYSYDRKDIADEGL